MQQKERLLYFDVMNVAACAIVILQHHNSHMHSFDGSLRWTVSLIIECLCYWTVPIFLMVSGANLIGYSKKYDTVTFFKKRVVRVLIPWLIWSVIMLFWKISTGQIVLEDKGVIHGIKLVLGNNVESVYWFFGTLFVLYLMTPVLTRLTEYRTLLWGMVIGIFIISALHPWLAEFFPIPSGMIDALRNTLLIYYLLGYLLNTAKLNKKQRGWLYAAGICAVIYRFFVSYYHSFAIGKASLLVRGNKMCNAMICASAVFVFIKQVKWEQILPKKMKKILPILASYSFGVYLLHIMVMYHLRGVLGIGIKSLAWKTIYALVTYLISIAVISILKQLPIVKKYIC